MSLGFLRALLITDPLIILSTAVCGAVNIAVSIFDDGGRRQIRIARFWARLLLRIAGVRVEVRGLDKLEPGGSYVFVSNHTSYMDTPAVIAHIPAQFRFLAKEGLFRIPLLGGHLKRAGHFSVPRDNPRAALRMMAEAGRIIRERRLSVLVFPEGGRTPDGTVQEFREGAAYIAIKSGVPAVPVTLAGLREVLPMGSMHVRPGRASITISDPIPTEGLTVHDRDRLTQQLYDRIVAALPAQPGGGTGVHSEVRPTRSAAPASDS